MRHPLRRSRRLRSRSREIKRRFHASAIRKYRAAARRPEFLVCRRSGFRRVEKSDARTGEPARHVAQLPDALAFAEASAHRIAGTNSLSLIFHRGRSLAGRSLLWSRRLPRRRTRSCSHARFFHEQDSALVLEARVRSVPGDDGTLQAAADHVCCLASYVLRVVGAVARWCGSPSESPNQAMERVYSASVIRDRARDGLASC
jgi:hypothetical protein